MPSTVRPAREEDAATMADLCNPLIAAGVRTVMDKPISVEEQVRLFRTFSRRAIFHVA
jgi:hypothetical protein